MTQLSRALLLLTCPVLGLACGEVPSNRPDMPPDAGGDAPDEVSIDAGVDADLPDTGVPPPPTNLVFLTSTTVTGNIGGRDKADATCNDLAHAAGHEGNFR